MGSSRGVGAQVWEGLMGSVRSLASALRDVGATGFQGEEG